MLSMGEGCFIMKTLLAVVLLCVGVDSTSPVEEIKGCIAPMINSPVCGNDGKTYYNEVELKCYQQYYPDLKMAYPRFCKNPAVKVDCQTPNILLPVCGSDGVSYNNMDELACNQRVTTGLVMRYGGSCKLQRRSKTTKECITSGAISPVCGSDGITYDNEQELKCYQEDKPDLKMASTGICKNPDLKKGDCVLPNILLRVCGTDNVSYNSVFEVQCNQKVHPDLLMKHFGPCIAELRLRVRQQPKKTPVCRATRNFDPVCGTDGKTYGNDGTLRCAQINNPGLGMKHRGRCNPPTQPKGKRPCVVSKVFRPVCGTDGKTYSNSGALRCAKRDNPGLKIKHNGACGSKPKPGPISDISDETDNDVQDKEPAPRPPPGKKNSCACPRNLDPTCGSDGKTYSNKCLLNCQAKKNPGLKVSHSGACESEESSASSSSSSSSPESKEK